MQLYLLRHGDAPFDAACGERILSPLGEEETARIIANRQAELAALTHIICSPSRRARETLAVLQKTITVTAPLIFDNCLRSESAVSRVENFIDKLANQPSTKILLVTHQPLVGSMYRYLLDQPSDTTFIGTSNLAAFNVTAFSRGCAELLWLDRP